jgi:hypothetical protein
MFAYLITSFIHSYLKISKQYVNRVMKTFYFQILKYLKTLYIQYFSITKFEKEKVSSHIFLSIIFLLIFILSLYFVPFSL